MSDAPARLKEMMDQEGIITAPGAHDAMTARIIQKEGFPCIYLTGAGVSASILGRPDLGLVTMTEAINQAFNIVSAVDIPVIADMDTGYGNLMNVIRTVESAERVGLAGIHIEDQTYPKRCGYLEGVGLVSIPEMQERIVAALRARKNPEFQIIARIDVKGASSFSEVLERGHAYIEAGPSMLFVNGLTKREEVEKVAEVFSIPQIYNVSTSGKAPFIPREELIELGFKIVIYPAFAALAATKAIMDLLQELKRTGTVENYLQQMITFDELNQILGISQLGEEERVIQDQIREHHN